MIDLFVGRLVIFSLLFFRQAFLKALVDVWLAKVHRALLAWNDELWNYATM